MSITIFGVIVIVIGLVLLVRGSETAMLVFVIVTTLLGGSAAFQLPSLGGSSIPPANLALIFLLLRVILPHPGQVGSLPRAITEMVYLIVFAVYGSVTAWILPKLFQGTVKVTPLHPGAVRELFESAPVHFSSQNITTSVYLIGTLIAGFGSYIGAAKRGSAETIVNTAIAVAVLHASLGLFSVAVVGTALYPVIDFFRNGHYAQLDQSIAGVSRMSGIWPEASGFAAFGGTWMIFMTELWLRDVRPRATGFAAILLAVALLISTSSTAYVTLAGYSVIFVLRAVAVPWAQQMRKIVILAIVGLAAISLVLATIAFVPSVFDRLSRILAIMTIEKSESFSGQQRAFWAKQGVDAFVASVGLGIGAGSFRSSSLLTAILGSMGLVGTIAFLAHLFRALQPFQASTWYGVRASRHAVGAAASWTCVLMLMPAAVSSPSADPGVVWAIFTGLALGLRALPAPNQELQAAAQRSATAIERVRVPM